MKFSPLYPWLFVAPDGDIFCHGVRKVNPHKHPTGYMYLNITVNGKKRSIRAHRVIASVLCSGFSPELWVNHKNGVRHDNRPENLEWVTPRENVLHAYDFGLKDSQRGSRHRAAKLKEQQVLDIRARAAAGELNGSLAAAFNVKHNTISDIVARTTWRHI